MVVSKEYKIGILVLLGSLLFFIGINYLKSGFSFGKDREFYAIFDNASGLTASCEVQINGVKVGEVLEVGNLPSNPQNVLVKFTFEKDEIEIPKTSQAWLISSDILGTKCIDLRIDRSDTASTEFFVSGDTMNSKKEISMGDEFTEQLTPVKEKTEKLIGSIETIIVSIKSFWDKDGGYTFEESVYQAREAIGTYQLLARNLTKLISSESQKIAVISKDVKEITDSIMNRQSNFTRIAKKVLMVDSTVTSSGLIAEMATLNSTMTDMNVLLTEVQSGKGNIGGFVYSEELKEAIEESKGLAKNLIKQITIDPMRFIGISILAKKVDGLQLTPEEEKILEDWLRN